MGRDFRRLIQTAECGGHQFTRLVTEAKRALNWGFDTKLTLDNPAVTRGVIPDHITHEKSKKRKTVCATTVVAAFGIDPVRFNNCGKVPDVVRILQRHGISVTDAQKRLKVFPLRRGSQPPRYQVDDIKNAIKMYRSSKAGKKAYYLLRTSDETGDEDGHVIIVDSHAEPQTRVDTDPQELDERWVTHAKMLLPSKKLLAQLEKEREAKEKEPAEPAEPAEPRTPRLPAWHMDVDRASGIYLPREYYTGEMSLADAKKLKKKARMRKGR